MNATDRTSRPYGIIHLMKMMQGLHFLNIHDLSLLEENENDAHIPTNIIPSYSTLVQRKER